MYKPDVCQNGRVAMLPAATRNYVSSILTSDLGNLLKKQFVHETLLFPEEDNY